MRCRRDSCPCDTSPHFRPTIDSVTVLECAIPHGRTARRLEWQHLPPHIRTAIEQRIGSPVVAAESQGGGFTPAFASVLTCEDGSRHFVKAASSKAQRSFAESYRQEARITGALPVDLATPQLAWVRDADDWVALGYPHHPHRMPERPWPAGDLSRALASLEATAVRLTPAPVGWGLPTLAEEIGGFAPLWERHVLRLHPDLPSGERAAAAAARVDELVGDTVVHCDVRDDNILLTDGGALLCDWTWAAVGPAWFDSLCLLIGAHGDGHDTDALLARLSLFADADPEHVTTALALVTGWFWKAGDDPAPTFSPYVRDAQTWLARAGWHWLEQRLSD